MEIHNRLSLIGCFILKEYYSILRNRVNLMIMISLPLFQVILYGYVVDRDPKNLPTIISMQDDSVLTKDLIQSLKNTHYFKIIEENTDTDAARRLMDKGKAQFIITIPYDFTRKLIRQKKTKFYIECDATDPLIISGAVLAAENAINSFSTRRLVGALSDIPAPQKPIEPVILSRYNPENKTIPAVLPSLIALTIMATLIYIASISVTREYDEASIELLFSSDVKADSMLIGKMTPYMIVAYIQLITCFSLSCLIFDFSIKGSFIDILLGTFPFMLANLAISIFISCIASNAIQALQFSGLYFLPSSIFGGFLFPIPGMPVWAQYLSDVFPLTNYVYILKGVTMKGASLDIYYLEILKMMIFFVIFLFLAIRAYNRRSDLYLAS